MTTSVKRIARGLELSFFKTLCEIPLSSFERKKFCEIGRRFSKIVLPVKLCVKLEGRLRLR